MSRADRIAEILDRWRASSDEDSRVDVDALIESHPDFAESLRAHFEAQEIVDQYFDQEMLVDPMAPPPNLGDYRIVRELGRGGMGVVYEAEQVSMGRQVALKVLFPTIASTRRTRKRFEREARVTGRLHHTNIVTVHGMGTEGGYLYFAMELVRGDPLDAVIGRLRAMDQGRVVESVGVADGLQGRDAYRRIAGMFAGVADALHVAHAQGVIHRDVKPSNLVLDEEGLLKLTDFGLAHLAGEGFGVTRTGEMIGTPLYMSPEQVRARREDVDLRTDVYSLGATLYELLARERPHDGADVGTLCSQILTQEPRPLREIDPAIPKDLATIAQKAMEKERADRYASAGAMAADLRAFAERRSIQARPIGLGRKLWRRARRHKVRTALGVAVLVLLLATGGLLSQRGEDQAEIARREYEELIRQAKSLSRDPLEPNMFATSAIRAKAGSEERTNRARALLDRAIELRPEAPEAYAMRSTLAGATAESREADLERARALGLPEWRYWLQRGAKHVVRGNLAAATEAVNKAETGGAPRDESFLWIRYWIANASKQTKEARALLDEYLLLPELSEFGRARGSLRRARRRMAEDNMEGAIEDLASLPAYGAPGNDSISLQIASLWGRANRKKRQQEIVDAVFERVRAKGTLEAWLKLQQELAALRLSTQRGRAARECLAAHPDAWRAKWAMAEWLLSGQFEATGDEPFKTGRERDEYALRLIEEVREEHPNPDLRLTRKALALFRLGRRGEGLAALDAMETPDALALSLRASALAEVGQVGEARALFEKIAQDEPDEHESHCNFALFLEAQRDFEALLPVVREAVRTDPNCPLSRGLLTSALFFTGHHEEAVAAADAELGLNPGNANAYARKALPLSRLHRYQECLEACAQARELNVPTNENLDSLEVTCHRQLGKRSEAWAALGRMRKTGGDPFRAFLFETELHCDAGHVEEALETVARARKALPGHFAIWDEQEVLFNMDLGRSEEARRAAARILLNQEGRHPISILRAAVVTGRVNWARTAAESVPWMEVPDLDDQNRCLVAATAHVLVGNTEKGFEYLEKAAAAGFKWSPHVHPDPDMKRIWDDPRFVALRKKHSVGD